MGKKTFAEELRILRNNKRLSQQQVADMLGIPNKSTVGSWEIGKGSPDPATLIKLCYIYGVGFDHFARECGIDVVPLEILEQVKENTAPSDTENGVMNILEDAGLFRPDVHISNAKLELIGRVVRIFFRATCN